MPLATESPNSVIVCLPVGGALREVPQPLESTRQINWPPTFSRSRSPAGFRILRFSRRFLFAAFAKHATKCLWLSGFLMVLDYFLND